MADQNLLSDLCSICHINLPQYRCPRCSCRTCSVQCVKRHKEWHQCSGKRDPTAKLSKAQLFTPAGIDHDFNFITGIERSRALLDTKVPQSDQIEGKSLRSGIASRNKNILDRLHLTRVNIEWAPEGLSRQRFNRTKWSKKTRQIVWTVEWIHQDGDKEFHQIHDSAPICREYAPVFLKHYKVESGKKRKRGAGSAKSDAAAEHETHAQAASSLSSSHGKEVQKGCVDPEKAAYPSLSVKTVPATNVEDVATIQTTEASNNAGHGKCDSAEGVISQTHPTKTSPVSELLRQPPGSPDDRGNYYYLLKPRTTGTETVLTVLSPTDNLLDCLRNQTVLEFPSIQILSQPPNSLPPGFILVHNWLEKFKKEQEEMKLVLNEAGHLDVGKTLSDLDEEDLPPGLQKMSNDNDILAMLQQDVLGRNRL
ncbi:hypothetical protein E2P81_ATG05044 [Venturia nashicola]|uniref:Box C/D snoRNA protein 1 n=1 Tax=Venturia nashicola TaxID=86259 RepID=A0A4Z1PFT4_9PEZI|nr:hypothetical protein E6O75_ATG05170 [Venturia nashicola]TLD34879.1 hypothetical protein E2P81_ATG05044 [Venturia nashicola]